MHDFRSTVERLCEKKVQPVHPEDLRVQLINYIEKNLERVTIDSVAYDNSVGLKNTTFLRRRDFDRIEVEAKKRGWFALVKNLDVEEANGKWVMGSYQFAPNYTDKVKPGRYLWHWAPASAKEKILKRGLTPRDKYNTDLSHLPQDQQMPARVYLFIDEGYAIGERETFTHRGEDYILWKVDIEAVGRGVNLHKDPEYNVEEGDPLVAVWTYSHIPAKALTLA